MDINNDNNTFVKNFNDLGINYEYINMDDVPDDAWGYSDDGNVLSNDDSNDVIEFLDDDNIPDEAWIEPNFVFEKFDNMEIDTLTKNLNNFENVLKIYKNNPTDAIKSIKEDFESLCAQGQTFIDENFLLRTLVKQINDKIAECEAFYNDIEFAKKCEEEEKTQQAELVKQNDYITRKMNKKRKKMQDDAVNYNNGLQKLGKPHKGDPYVISLGKNANRPQRSLELYDNYPKFEIDDEGRQRLPINDTEYRKFLNIDDKNKVKHFERKQNKIESIEIPNISMDEYLKMNESERLLITEKNKLNRQTNNYLKWLNRMCGPVGVKKEEEGDDVDIV